MRLLSAAILVFAFGQVSAQKITNQSVRVFDAKSLEAIENVYFKFLGKVYSSNRSGTVRIAVSETDTLHISHISYRDTLIPVTPSDRSIEIALKRLLNDIAEVTVSDRPLEIFAPEESHVFDFQFIGDTLLVLTYEKEFLFRKVGEQSQEMYAGCELVMVLPSGNILSRLPLPDRIQGFYQDGLGQIFLIGRALNWFVKIEGGKILKEPVSREKFENQVLPLKAATTVGYVCDDYNWQYPEFSYYFKHEENDNYHKLRTVRDKMTMELFRAEYKYMSGFDKLRAIRLEASTGIDKEIYAAYMTGFQHSLYYQKLYAPIFCQNDTLVIFDHHSKTIFGHSPNGLPLYSIPISYLNNLGNLNFSDELINDITHKTFYARYRRNGRNYLKKLELSSGKAGMLIELFHPYPEKIKIRNGIAYYLYRRTGSSDTKHLFAERL